MSISESSKRIQRLLNIVILIKTEPWQTVAGLTNRLCISRSQFYEVEPFCGVGGSVFCRDPELAAQWQHRLLGPDQGQRVITYYAGFAAFWGRHHTVHHLADLILYPKKTFDNKAKVVISSFTYLHQ